MEVVCNPFDCRGDSKKHMPYKHALSVATNEHAMWTVAIKTVAVLSATFLGTMHPTAVGLRRPGNFTHQADGAAAVDQLEAPLGQGGPKRLGRETQGVINSIA